MLPSWFDVHNILGCNPYVSYCSTPQEWEDVDDDDCDDEDCALPTFAPADDFYHASGSAMVVSK